MALDAALYSGSNRRKRDLVVTESDPPPGAPPLHRATIRS